ncbi:MAG: outer membrane protein assembly factor BamD [Candidatus Eisenbacteria bacterium]|nr:outer membrane protein assembly factor BamD [Candidatus Eisenbacteria bacterium]
MRGSSGRSKRIRLPSRAALSWLRRALPLVLLAVLGCGGSAPRIETLPSSDAELAPGREAFERGDYTRAVEKLTAFLDAHPGSSQLDQVLFLLGRAHQNLGENLLAAERYDRLIRDFPQSPLREEAEYRLAESYLDESLGPAYDPESTENALSLLRAYLVRYPNGSFADLVRAGIDQATEKLARKAYLNAITYQRLDKPRGAILYLNKALEMKPDFGRAGDALAMLARNEERLGEWPEARKAWERLLEYATPERIARDSDLRGLKAEAEQRLRSLAARNASGGTP